MFNIACNLFLFRNLLLCWDGSAARLSFHLNGAVFTLVSYYLTSPIVLVAFLSVFLTHSNQ